MVRKRTLPHQSTRFATKKYPRAGYGLHALKLTSIDAGTVTSAG